MRPGVGIRLPVLLWPGWLDSWWVRRARRALGSPTVTTYSQPRRLFVDVSVVVRHDAGTGIQRVVRALTSELLVQHYDGWEIHAVAATANHAYQQVSWDNRPYAVSAPLAIRPGDVFLGLDFALDTVCRHRRQLAALRSQGVKLWFLMYDLLPVQRPDWFSARLVVRYHRWLRVLAALADGFFCISTPVESDLREVMSRRYKVSNEAATRVLPMAGDLSASMPSQGYPDGFDTLMSALGERPTALMVGTLEPRKGHADALAAFELLWERGTPANLVIVGRPGWHTESLQAALRSHSELGKRLFWLPNASDEALERLYLACDGVIAASYAEGFGLPIIEALAYGKAVLARDIPVFRVHQKQNVEYFPERAEPLAIAELISTWLSTAGEKSQPMPAALAQWSDAAKCIIATLSLESS